MALEVGEKLTSRVLKTSDTKKTVLINRGIEDGLEKGNQAMFYLSKGVVARGVLRKVSPTRSVWSIYRISDSSELRADNVLKLKVIPSAPLTSDETRGVVAESRGSTDSEMLDIPLAEGASDAGKYDEFETAPRRGRRGNRQQRQSQPTSGQLGGLEGWGALQLNSLSITDESDSNQGPFDGKLSNIQLTTGVEYYFKDKKKWFDKFSFYGFLQYWDQKTTGADSVISTTNSFEYGLGVSYHFLNHPRTFAKPILFLTTGYALGTAKATREPTSGNISEFPSGSVTSFFLGGGVKYYFYKGLGLRATLDYYSSAHKYDADSNNNLWDRSLNGFRWMLGISYRFGK